jgi:hypothetical protein
LKSVAAVLGIAPLPLEPGRYQLKGLKTDLLILNPYAMVADVTIDDVVHRVRLALRGDVFAGAVWPVAKPGDTPSETGSDGAVAIGTVTARLFPPEIELSLDTGELCGYEVVSKKHRIR